MGIISILLLIIFIISALLLIFMVLVQDDQGDGLGSMLGGGSSTAFGSRSGNILTRFTSILAVVFMSSAFALAWFNIAQSEGDVEGAARRMAADAAQTEWWNDAPAENAAAE